jgi:hypothetical protein
MKTGYSAGTLMRRLQQMSEELLLMADDGRLPEGEAHKVRIRLLQAILVLEKGRKDYYRRRDETED